MAIAFAAIGAGLTRFGNFVSNTANWTRIGWFNPITADPTGSAYRTFYVYGDPHYTGPYIWIGTGAGAGNKGTIQLEVNDGTNNFDSIVFTVPLDAWFPWALSYNATTKALKFYVGTQQSGITVDLGPIAFGAQEYVASDGASWPNIAVGVFGSWSFEMALNQIQQQWLSQTMLQSGTCTSFSSMIGPSGSQDASGHGRHWGVSGGTPCPDPFPTNNLWTGAIDLGTAPATATQRVDVGGMVMTVWYKWTAPITGMASVWAYGEVNVYKPNMAPYLSPNVVDNYMGIGTYVNSNGGLTPPIQMPTRAGETYLFGVSTPFQNMTIAAPANLTIKVSMFAAYTIVPRESIAINDDNTPQTRGDGTYDTAPLVLHSTTADYTPMRFVPSFTPGETGDCLNDGTSLVGNDDTNDPLALFRYDSQFLPLGSTAIASLASVLEDIRANRALGKFFVLYYDNGHPSLPHIARVSATGTIEWTSSALAVSSAVLCIATSPDGTIGYFCDLKTPAAVRRWDLVNDVALSDFVVEPNGGFGSDMLVLSDGSVIVYIASGSVLLQQIRRYSAAGVLLRTWSTTDLGVTSFSGSDSRMSQSIDDMTFWYRNAGTEGVFIKIDAVSGAVLKRIKTAVFEWGKSSAIYMTPADPPVMFGHSGSCTFWIVPTPVGPGGGGAPAPGTGVGPGAPPTGPLGGVLRNIRRLRQGPHINDAGRQLFGSIFRVDLQNALGAQINPLDTPPVPAPLAWHSQTEDGGLHWTPYESAPAGGTVDEDIDVEWRRLGVAADRCDRIVVEDPIPWRITNAYIDILPGSY